VVAHKYVIVPSTKYTHASKHTADVPKSIVVVTGAVIESDVVVNFALPDVSVYVNGIVGFTAGVPTSVIARAAAVLSLNLEDWQVSNDVDVPVIADMFVPELCVIASGAVGGVNAPVYTATPLTTRRLDM
jgi:hypothetical protein